MDNKTLYDRLLKSQANDLMLNDKDYEDIAEDFYDEEKDDIIDIESEFKGGDLYGGAMKRRSMRGRGLSGGLMYGGGDSGGGLSGGRPVKRNGKCPGGYSKVRPKNGFNFCRKKKVLKPKKQVGKLNKWQACVKKHLKPLLKKYMALPDNLSHREAFSYAIKDLAGRYRDNNKKCYN
jgi:hypothetical protein